MRKLQGLLPANATPRAKQHRSPCSDCPWARKSLAGWVGALSPMDWIRYAFSDNRIECHTRPQAGIVRTWWQCAGAAIFRANICKVPRDPDVMQDLAPDTVRVFATPREFLNHHENGKGKSWPV